MSADHRGLRDAIVRELDRIDEVATQLWDGDCDFTTDSGHPGWTYGHVATHIARGSDILADAVLSLSGETGDLQQRALERSAEIGSEATRPGAVIITDFEHATRRFARIVDTVPVENWPTTPVPTGGRAASISDLVGTWLGEMRLHVPALHLNGKQISRISADKCLLIDLLPAAAHPPREVDMPDVGPSVRP